jgi:hypothetical protein
MLNQTAWVDPRDAWRAEAVRRAKREAELMWPEDDPRRAKAEQELTDRYYSQMCGGSR